MEQEIENADSPNSEEIVTEEVTTPEEETETVESLTEKNKQLFARAKKAEGFEFVDNQWVKKPKVEQKPVAPSESGTLSSSDLLAIMKADIHEDDIDRVEKFAKDNNLKVKDALKDDELKAILSVRTEKRATANGANISNVRRGSAKVTDETLIANANAGKLPESDEDIERLIKAKSKRK